MVSPSALNRLNDKGRPCGLYLKIEGKNKIKRTLVSFEKETELPPTTIENEIISLTDVDFKIYEDRINLTNEFSQRFILNRRLIRRKHLKIFIETTEEFIFAFERDDPLHGVLTRTLLEDLLKNKDLKTSMKESISFTVNAVNHCFSDIPLLGGSCIIPNSCLAIIFPYNYFFFKLIISNILSVQNNSIKMEDEV